MMGTSYYTRKTANEFFHLKSGTYNHVRKHWIAQALSSLKSSLDNHTDIIAAAQAV
jgi:hypothetical protein